MSVAAPAVKAEEHTAEEELLVARGGATSTSAAATTVAALRKEACAYTACYCEENVYRLCERLAAAKIAREDLSDLLVVFISNQRQHIALWRQKAGKAADGGLCLWDYHVICVQTSVQHGALVWDLDTTLDFPVSIKEYQRQALRLYRIVAAPSFRDAFASDRRHMRNRDGSWIAPPPPGDCIRGRGAQSAHNLGDYIKMSNDMLDTDRKSTSAETAPLKQWLQNRVNSALGAVVEEIAFLSFLSNSM
eukprot:jgi/Chlat1/5093/Chrsp33S05023